MRAKYLDLVLTEIVFAPWLEKNIRLPVYCIDKKDIIIRMVIIFEIKLEYNTLRYSDEFLFLVIRLVKFLAFSHTFFEIHE